MTDEDDPTAVLPEEHDEVSIPLEREPAPEPKQKMTARDAALVSVRVATGVVGVGVAAAVIALATLVPLPTLSAQPASDRITPVATAQQLVCPGAMLRLGDDQGEAAGDASAIGAPDYDGAADSGELAQTAFSASAAGTADTDAAPRLLSSPPGDGDEPVLLSGAQSQQLDSGDVNGLTAAGCEAARGDSWLVGGATDVGRTTVITLANPSEVAATVDLEVFGESGLVEAPGTSGIIVPAGDQRVLSLAGFQPGLVSPVVHVSSEGGQVVAGLQQTTVRGLEAGGVDLIGAAAQPARSTVIPGLVLDDTAATQAFVGRGEGYEDARTTVRLFSPVASGAETDAPVQATVSLIPEDDSGTGASFDVELQGGRVTDVPLEDVPDGRYTVSVDAQERVVAAVRATTASDDATDFAWLVASPVLGDTAQVTVAQGPSPRLHLANTTVEELTVTVGDGDSADEIELGPGATVSVALGAGRTYALTGTTGVAAAVTLSAADGLARYSVTPPGAGSEPITVY
jgi:hypothetical protein